MALANGSYLHCTNIQISCKFFSETYEKIGYGHLKNLGEQSRAILALLSYNVFHSYISIVRQNVALCGNGLMIIVPLVKNIYFILRLVLIYEKENQGQVAIKIFWHSYPPFELTFSQEFSFAAKHW